MILLRPHLVRIMVRIFVFLHAEYYVNSAAPRITDMVIPSSGRLLGFRGGKLLVLNNIGVIRDDGWKMNGVRPVVSAFVVNDRYDRDIAGVGWFYGIADSFSDGQLFFVD